MMIMPPNVSRTTLKHNLEVIHLENDACEALIALQGAQILRFRSKASAKNSAENSTKNSAQHDLKHGFQHSLEASNPQHNSELLWLSSDLPKQGEKAIRGGIPLCFPWFGAHPQQPHLPAHGFARTCLWTLESIDHADDMHRLQFILHSSAQTKRYWDYDFQARMIIGCGQDLSLELQVFNTDDRTFEFSFAWHSYFSVQKLADVRIMGLAQTHYIDQLLANKPQFEVAHQVQIEAETDRIYCQTQRAFEIQESNRCIQINSPDCPDAVLWNPWVDKAARLIDMDDAAWQEFVCLESGHIQHGLELKPQQSKHFKMTLKLNLD